jgi:hypothetical protein
MKQRRNSLVVWFVTRRRCFMSSVWLFTQNFSFVVMYSYALYSSADIVRRLNIFRLFIIMLHCVCTRNYTLLSLCIG